MSDRPEVLEGRLRRTKPLAVLALAILALAVPALAVLLPFAARAQQVQLGFEVR